MSMLQRDMGVVKGWQTELVVERRARAVFRRLCGGHMHRICPTGNCGIHRTLWAGRGYVRGRVHTGRYSRFPSGRHRFPKSGGDVRGRVFYTIGVDDSDRAIDRAALLTRTLGREVRPAVVGETATARFEADAARRNVAYTYIGNGHGITR